MVKQLLHTPEGVRDIYDQECEKKHSVETKIQKVFHLHGFRDIETPTFEFFDIFNKERGSAGSKEMYKFFDRDNNTLVLKPDMTPAIARCVAKYFSEESMPIRLCYLERTFINNSSYQGRLKETTQTGAELIGEDSADADAEMVAMVIESLRSVGLQELQVELGQVEFFRGLVEEAGMDADTEEELRILIENKNYFGVEELVNRQAMSEELRSVFLKLPELFGSMEQISSAKSMTSNLRAVKAIERLEQIHRLLESYGLADYVSYDLGMLSKFKYYTGIIFKAYTYGTGDYIVNGGRYDKLLVQFGKDAPAVGFAIVVDQLLMAMTRQKLNFDLTIVNSMILYEESAQSNAIKLAGWIRKSSMYIISNRRNTEKTIEEYQDYAVNHGIRNILYLEQDGQVVSLIEAATGTTDQIPLSAYRKED